MLMLMSELQFEECYEDCAWCGYLRTNNVVYRNVNVIWVCPKFLFSKYLIRRDYERNIED